MTNKGTHGTDNELIYVGEITESLVCEFRLWRLKNRKKTTTVNKCLTPILSACEQAARLGYLSKDVNASIQDLYRYLDSKMLYGKASDIIFSGEELSRQQA
jgi:hypothetical protein